MSKTEKPYKEGETLYEVCLDSDTGKFETDIWIVRTIRGGKITAICKNEYTWVKLTKKHGDWGWDPNIPAIWRETWAVGRHPRRNIRRTRLEAWTLERDQLKSWMDEGEMLDKAIKTADAQISKHKKAKT